MKYYIELFQIFKRKAKNRLEKIYAGVMNIFGRKKLIFYWQKEFLEYFSNNDTNEKLNNLKQGLDEISIQYIDDFMKNSKNWNRYIPSMEEKSWSLYDKKLFSLSDEGFIQPFEEIVKIDPIMYQTIYGMKDVPNLIELVNGRDVVDAGGYLGDTAYIFSNKFPNSNIFVYEPLKRNAEKILCVKKKLKSDKITVIPKGLGDKKENIEIKFNYTENAEITTLDEDYKGNNLGLIKADTEGFETKIIKGAKNLIRTQKPILAIAMYHTPKDFFELKDEILKLNPEYKFMVRRSEFVIPTADLVLIAY